MLLNIYLASSWTTSLSPILYRLFRKSNLSAIKQKWIRKTVINNFVTKAVIFFYFNIGGDIQKIANETILFVVVSDECFIILQLNYM